MLKVKGVISIILWIVLLTHVQVSSQTRERSEVPEKYKWDLSDLYPTDSAWTEAKNKVTARMDKIASFKGTLAESASRLLACLDFSNEISKELLRMSSYSYNKTNQDLRNPLYRAMDQETNQLITVYAANASFIKPEILALEKKTVLEFMNAEQDLKPYTSYLNDLMRQKKHTLSGKEEKVIAEAGRMSLAPSSLYNALIYGDLIETEVTLSTGETVKLDRTGFDRYRRLADREDRELVYRRFYGELNKFRSAFGALMNAKVNTDIFNTRVRGYGDSVEMTLEPDNIPVAIFQDLIANSTRHLVKFHRYLNIRQRLLGVDTLKSTDLSIPAFDGIDLNYDIEDAKALILESLKPLGQVYTSIIKEAFESRWIDFFPTPGKRSGYYTDFGAYAEHPYILMNYAGQYSDVSAMVHELGHALHRYLADRAQPFPTPNYSSLIAEVASLFNEKLLRKNVLEKVKDENIRLSLLLAGIDKERAIFGQAMVSEFEWRIHREAENDRSLTGDSISKIYLETLRKYYGHDEGICYVPDYMDMDWVFDRLLFIDTYRIYVYAPSQTAATVLAEKVLSGEKGAVEKYLDFLSAGGSVYPIDLLQKAGVDMTSPEPFEKTMDVMDRMMDEIERILENKGK
jgi:oligoendopeptidase F